MKKGISSWKALRMFALAGVLGMLWGGMTGCGLEAAVEGDAGAYEPRERVLYDLASNQWKEQKEAEAELPAAPAPAVQETGSRPAQSC